MSRRVIRSVVVFSVLGIAAVLTFVIMILPVQYSEPVRTEPVLRLMI